MKRSGALAVEKSETSDLVKRLYKNAVELVRMLEKGVQNANSCKDLCQSNGLALRIRLRDICERLIFIDPIGLGKKAEDLMWKKVYYEVISAAKKFKKAKTWSKSDSYWVNQHVRLGYGYYHHLMFRLMTEFDLSLEGRADFMLMTNLYNSLRERGKSRKQLCQVDEKKECAKQIYQRCLIYLGDLARYQQEFSGKNVDDAARRYYHQALNVLPNHGMPHNQLGTISASRNYGCDAAYYYMRCLLSGSAFDGASGNLKRIFERNREVLNESTKELDGCDIKTKELLMKNFVCSFLEYCNVCFKYPDVSPTIAMEEVCQEVLYTFQSYLETCDLPPDEFFEECSVKEDNSSGDILFLTFVMSLMCIERLNNLGSASVSAATAFTLAFYSDILHCTMLCFRQKFSNVQESTTTSLSNVLMQRMNSDQRAAATDEKLVSSDSDKSGDRAKSSSPDIKELLLKSRRRQLKSGSIDDSDFSEDQGSGTEVEGSTKFEMAEDGGSDVSSSFSEDDCANVDENHVLENGCTDDSEMKPTIKITSCQKSVAKTDDKNATADSISDQITSAAALKVLIDASHLLSIIKIGGDWLQSQPSIVMACAKGSQLLWARLVNVLNILVTLENLASESSDDTQLCISPQLHNWADSTWLQPWPLPEDVNLRGLNTISKAHSHLKFGSEHATWLSDSDEVAVRVACIKQFGFHMASLECTLLHYDTTAGKFVHKNSGAQKTTAPSSTTQHKDVGLHRKQLMQNMAQLWLQAEVQELESSVKAPTRGANLPPYLVLDTLVLSEHLAILKELLTTKQFVCIVPIVVIHSLDKVKKTSLGAREAIRWLEGELQRGSRYIRAQKPQEYMAIPLFKYPKKKDQEAWTAFRVLECCNYIGHKGGASSELCANLVTLVTSAGNAQAFHYTSLGKSAGISIEDIETIHAKWKKSSKPHS